MEENRQDVAIQFANELKQVCSAKDVRIRSCSSCGFFVRIDALDKKDYPNNIAENSIYLEFHVDTDAQRVGLSRQGCIWLSPADQQSPKFRGFAMRGMVDIAAERGTPKFRKQGYKSFPALIKKMNDYYNNVMDAVIQYTGGYPYKQGI